MGLDITAYEAVECIGETDHDDPRDDVRNLWVEHGRKDRAAPLFTGLYRISGNHKSFYAGGYFGYNQWRGWLSRTMLGVEQKAIWDNPDAYTGQPFVELIDFSDCEGTIGPIVSAKLAKDFADHRGIAIADTDNAGDDGRHCLQKYDNWHECFKLAADNGAVSFH